MKKSLLTVLALLFGFGSTCFAQENLASKQQNNDPCAQFKMRVVTPAENLDPKIVITVDAQLDPRMVLNPCPGIPKVVAQAKPLPEQESNQQQNALSPSLRLTLPNNESKTPSEMLRQFSIPKTPKPNR